MPIQSMFAVPFRKAACVALCASFLVLAASSHAQSSINLTAAQSLQDALDNVADGGVIELAAGTYAAPAGGWHIYPDLSGGTKSLTVRALNGANVVLDGGGTTQIFTFTTPKPVTFQGLTFANGVSTVDFHGGAMSTDHVQATFISCTFQNNAGNAPTTGGGGLWLASSTVLFQSCTWTNNTSMHYGGALSSDQSRVYIRDSKFTGNRVNVPNHSFFSAGGAINGNASTIHLDNTRFDSNQAGYVGGAIYVYGGWQDPVTTPRMNLVVNNCLFTGNFVLKDPSSSFTAPTAGGAIQLEDQTKGSFYNCRFINNNAKQGGAIASYRTVTDFQGCVFKNNEAKGTDPSDGLGGAIFVISDDNPGDSTVNGTVNRPSARLSVTDCLFQGPGGGVISAHQGGGIFVAGDLHAMYGQGVNKNGTLEVNRAVATLQRVVFADLATSDTGNSSGGALTGDFVNLSADHCIVQNCSTTQYGGGFEFVRESTVNITNTTFAKNSAGLLGGGITMFGGFMNLDRCNFLDNSLTGPGANGGWSIMTAPDAGGGGLPAFDMTGFVQNCVLNNIGGSYAIYDNDRNPPSTPFNRMQYNGNQIYPGDRTTLFNDNLGAFDVAALNLLKIARLDGTTSIKSAVPNAGLGSPGVTGQILMVPPTVLSSGAPGETLPLPAYLGFTASGGTPSLDGSAQRTFAGVVPTSVNGVHTLTVGSSSFSTVPPAGNALNISTRLPVGTDQSVLIGGFIIQGPAPKTVILRAIGPTLTDFGVAGALADPTLELYQGNTLLATNDNWRTTQIGGLLTSNQSIDIMASTVAPSKDAESAILVTLAPGAYTAIVRGAGNTTGIAVIEGYDLDADKTSTLANISTRGFVQTNNDVMIGGFIYGGGSGATKVVVRGIGPSLAAFGINNTLADPMLDLRDAQGTSVGSNDDWKIPNQAAIQGTGLQPSKDAESAILVTNLPPGQYTAILQGKNSGTGVGVVEVYVFQ
jgi:hypothetical protein